MSKALSANIHDPNHTADEYDLYFNGEPIETGGGGCTWIVKTIAATENDILTVQLDDPLPETFHAVGYGLSGSYTNTNILTFSNEGNGNSHGLIVNGFNTTTTPPSVSRQAMGYRFAISEDRKRLQISAQAPTSTFIIGKNYVVFIAY